MTTLRRRQNGWLEHSLKVFKIYIVRLTLLCHWLMVLNGIDVRESHYVAKRMAKGWGQYAIGSDEDPAYIPAENRSVQKLKP